MNAQPTRTLSTADERRDAIVEAALPIFAEEGFRAASTLRIAKATGISQAYLFKLFPTKVDLFVAACAVVRERLLERMREAADGVDEAERLTAMGCAYEELLAEEPDLLRLQIQSQAVSGEPDIDAAMQTTFRELYALAAERSDATEEELRGWFAAGMLINVMATIGARGLDEPWAKTLTGEFESDATKGGTP